jgi:hypothetical protein
VPTIQIEASVSSQDLLRAAEQLDPGELDEFIQAAIVLQARRRAPSLSRSETELLQRINAGVPSEIQTRYDALIAKRDAEALTPEEHAELLKLTDVVEQIDVQRVSDLVDLAQLRGISLRQLMDNLGIHGSTRA